jgi:polysaccharide biosynthesis transport protein
VSLGGAPESFAPAFGAEMAPSLDVKAVWRLVRGRWRWIAALTAIGLCLGVAKYFVSPKLYRATTIIQIEPRNMVPVGQDRNPWIEQWTNMKYFPTQYRLLRSRGLAERVIDDLRLDSDPAFASPRRAGDGPFTAEEDERYKAGLASRLVGGLTVEPIEGTELLSLSYVSTDAKLAADLANGFANAFIDWGIESRSETLQSASRIINTQIENLRHDVEALELAIQRFSRDSEVSATDAGASSVNQRVQSLDQQYTAAASALLTKQQQYNQIASMTDELAAETFGRAGIVALRDEWERKKTTYETRLQTFKPDHPEMVDLSAEVETARRRYEREIAAEALKLRTAARNDMQAAQQLLQSIERQRGEAQRQRLDLNVESLPLSNMQMELTAKRERLSELVESQSQADLSADVQVDVRSNVHVIDRALLPGEPFRPSLRQNVGLGGGLGALLGLLVVFLFHFLDRTIKGAEELEALLALPVLATVPDITVDGRASGYSYASYGYGRKSRKPDRKATDGPIEIELLPETHPRLAVSEAYRSLRTALLLSSADELKVVTITSAEAGEGKSATATNLSAVMAQLGKKVLLIDADLRKARLHRIFQTSNSHGLVDCLTAGSDPGTLIQKTLLPGLHLLPSGAHPPNPSELLASARMKQLANWARKNFDFVVIDSPPILAVSDAILPAALSDGVILCFRAGQIERETARRCTEQLRLSGIKILGIVLNRYRPGASRYYDRRYETYEAYAEPHADSAA